MNGVVSSERVTTVMQRSHEARRVRHADRPMATQVTTDCHVFEAFIIADRVVNLFGESTPIAVV